MNKHASMRNVLSKLLSCNHNNVVNASNNQDVRRAVDASMLQIMNSLDRFVILTYWRRHLIRLNQIKGPVTWKINE